MSATEFRFKKFEVGGHPPKRVRRRRSKYQRLFNEIDEIEIGVWAKTVLYNKGDVGKVVSAIRKYLRPRNINIIYVTEPVGATIKLWIKKIDMNEVE